MAIIRVKKSKNYTTMSNYHLQDKRLTLRTIGLMSIMLSLPDNWDFSIAGLNVIIGDSKNKIRLSLVELEKYGYLERKRNRDKKGKLTDTEYILYECPKFKNPTLENPTLENPTLDNPTLENSTQLNTKENKVLNKLSTNISSSTNNTDISYFCFTDENGDIDFDRLIKTYNCFCKKLIKSDSIRPEIIDKIIEKYDEYGEDAIIGVFQKANHSTFLKADKGWKCDINWIFDEDHFEAIAKGRYDDEFHPNNQNYLSKAKRKTQAKLIEETENF